MWSDRDIRNKLSALKQLDNIAYNNLSSKIEFNKIQRIKKTSRQVARRYLAGGIKEYAKRLGIKDIINIINRPSPKKIILYVSALPTFNLVRQSIYLRKTGEFETIILTESPWLGNFTEKYFDTVYVYDSIYMLANILKEVNPYLIHVLGCSYYSEYHAILAKYLSKCHVLFEFYDIPSLSLSRDDVTDMHGKTNADLIFFSEKFVCEKSDGLILGYSHEALDLLKENYDIKTPTLEFHSYACEEFVSSNGRKYSGKDNKIRLVYGGNVAPSNYSEKLFGDVQFHRLARKLTDQGICFDIYYSPHISPVKAKQQYWDYLRIAQENDLFNFNKGLHPDKVAKEFAKYDFGAMIYLYDKGTFMEEHNSTRLPGKFFTYIEAGLPIIVSEECGYAAKLVNEYEMGIVVKQNDIDNLADIIEKYDMKKLMSNVEKAKKDLSMKNNVRRLIEFYEQIVHGNN